jgi:hypothetical protein
LLLLPVSDNNSPYYQALWLRPYRLGSFAPPAIRYLLRLDT